MARLKKRKDGYLKKSFTFGGKRIYVYGRNSAELLENEIRKKKELEQKEEDLYNPTLIDYYKHFTDIRRKELKESTLRAQKFQFEMIANVIMVNGRKFGEMRIKAITRRDIETVRESLLKQGKTPQHLNISFAHLNHVFNNALLDDTLEKNPCKALKQLKRDIPPINETKHRALSIDETKLFFEAAEQRNSYYLNDFLIMLKTGLRIGELSALYPTDIDKKSGFIHVRRTIMRDETGRYAVGENTKTKNGARDIPLTAEILEVIREQEALNRMIFGFKKKDL